MSKLTDMIVSAIIKRGIFYEARNVDTTIDIPTGTESTDGIITVHITAEHMTIRIEKDEKEA